MKLQSKSHLENNLEKRYDFCNACNDQQTVCCNVKELLYLFAALPGVTLNTLLGRKGCLEKMKDYWDVGFYLGANILSNEHKKIMEASEKLYRLSPPIWWDWSWRFSSQSGINQSIAAWFSFNVCVETILLLPGLWPPSWRRSFCTGSLPNCPRWNIPNRTLWTSGWSCCCRPTSPPSPQIAAQ